MTAPVCPLKAWQFTFKTLKGQTGKAENPGAESLGPFFYKSTFYIQVLLKLYPFPEQICYLFEINNNEEMILIQIELVIKLQIPLIQFQQNLYIKSTLIKKRAPNSQLLDFLLFQSVLQESQTQIALLLKDRLEQSCKFRRLWRVLDKICIIITENQICPMKQTNELIKLKNEEKAIKNETKLLSIIDKEGINSKISKALINGWRFRKPRINNQSQDDMMEPENFRRKKRAKRSSELDNKIKKLYQSKQLTIQQICQQCGVSPEFLRKVVKEDKNIQGRRQKKQNKPSKNDSKI